MSHKNTFMFVLAMLPAVMLQAQETPSRGAAPTPKAVVQSDAILATWLHVASSKEITLAGVAQRQAHSPEVRAFAQKMIDDHTAFAAKLKPLTTATSMGGGERGGADRGNQGKEKSPADAGSARAHAMVGGFDHAALLRELGDKCVQSETKMLSSKTGIEFDRCYMRMQVASHVRGADMIEVFKNHASASLVPTLDEGQKTIAAHLEHAKTLCKQVEEGVAGENGSGNGGGKSPRDGR